MFLGISPETYQELVKHGEDSPVHEVCGALLGTKTDEDYWECDEFVPLTNVNRETPEINYMPDPNELFQVLNRTTHMNDDADKDLIGIFHTHPHHEPRPSITDLNGAGYQGFYLIYSPKFEKMGAYFYAGDAPIFEDAYIMQNIAEG